MKNRTRTISLVSSFIILAILLFCQNYMAFAQVEIQKEVRVVKPYTPTLSEANKISLLPVFNDTIRVTPNFGYVVYPKRFETDYKIEPIKPAKMVGLPISKLYKSQLTLGAGNYNTPFMELSVSQLRSKNSQIGLYLNHLSSSGKIKLENNKKVHSGYSDNLMKLYGKRIFREAVLEADISGGYNTVTYYGYDPVIDTIDYKMDRQKIYSAGAGLKYYSMHSDSSHLNYKSEFDYDVVNDFYKNTEHHIDISTALNKKIGDQVVGGDFRVRYFNKTASLDSSSFSVVDLTPWYSRNTNEWKFLLGLNMNVDQSAEKPLKVYPRVNFEFNIVPEVLIPYLGINGYREINNYGKILFENPFLNPGTSVLNSNHALIVFAGLKGRYSDKIAFNLKGSYEKTDSMYFFENDSSDILRNKFVPVYDNATFTSLGGEISWYQSEKLQLLMKANYYQYQLTNLKHPWHKPSFEASISADYSLQEKILIGTDIFLTGKRFAPSSDGTPITLKAYLDANLSVNYRYTKTISFFLKFNNLTASRYQLWNQYPAQRFQFLAGFSYAL